MAWWIMGGIELVGRLPVKYGHPIPAKVKKDEQILQWILNNNINWCI